MAKNKSSRVGRDTSDIAKRSLPLPFLTSFPSPRPVFTTQLSLPLTEVEDRRVFHPSGPVRPALNRNGRQHQLKASGTLYHPRAGFQDEHRVLVCVRRKQREEVLHAKRKTGKKGQRKPRFNYYSSITCKG